MYGYSPFVTAMFLLAAAGVVFFIGYKFGKTTGRG